MDAEVLLKSVTFTFFKYSWCHKSELTNDAGRFCLSSSWLLLCRLSIKWKDPLMPRQKSINYRHHAHCSWCTRVACCRLSHGAWSPAVESCSDFLKQIIYLWIYLLSLINISLQATVSEEIRLVFIFKTFLRTRVCEVCVSPACPSVTSPAAQSHSAGGH